MQPLYPYFAIYRGPKKAEELRKYIYSHAQALNNIGEKNKEIKEKVTILTDSCSKNINENVSKLAFAKDYIRHYREKGGK